MGPKAEQIIEDIRTELREVRAEQSVLRNEMSDIRSLVRPPFASHSVLQGQWRPTFPVELLTQPPESFPPKENQRRILFVMTRRKPSTHFNRLREVLPVWPFTDQNGSSYVMEHNRRGVQNVDWDLRRTSLGYRINLEDGHLVGLHDVDATSLYEFGSGIDPFVDLSLFRPEVPEEPVVPITVQSGDVLSWWPILYGDSPYGVQSVLWYDEQLYLVWWGSAPNQEWRRVSEGRILTLSGVDITSNFKFGPPIPESAWPV